MVLGLHLVLLKQLKTQPGSHSERMEEVNASKIISSEMKVFFFIRQQFCGQMLKVAQLQGQLWISWGRKGVQYFLIAY
jgi:hypothetical protein